MIKNLSIRVYNYEHNDKFQFYDGGISDMYLKNLNNIDTGVVKYINIYFTKVDHLKIIEDESFLDINVYFDFDFFEKLLNNFQKKKYIIEKIQDAFMSLCDKFNWEKSEFVNSFSICFSKNLNHEWRFKNKLFISPNKQYYFELLCKADISTFEIYEILYDSKKNELSSRICFKDKVHVFSIEKAYWDENSLFFYYKFKGPSKIFIAKIEDLVNNVQYNLTEDISLFFKK